MVDARNADQNKKLPDVKYLKNYAAPDFLIDRVALDFDLRKNVTHVRATSRFKRRVQRDGPLILAGSDMTLKSVSVNGCV